MNQSKRLEELKAKDTLTYADMQELIRLNPPGCFKTSPVRLQDLGVIDLEQAFINFEEGAVRSKHAMENQCYLEVISLRLQHSEFWLRLFWAVKNSKQKIFNANDKRTFGTIVNDCEVAGFRADLIARLRVFARHRNDAIHKFLLGGTKYETLKQVCDESYGIDKEVGLYVRDQVGTPMS